jgi:cell shape-determining protein MreD
MNWIVFGIVAWVFLGMESGLREALQVGQLNIAPSFVLILIVFVSLWAKPIHALWAAVLLGCALDMLNLLPTESGETIAMLGPWALGCMVASYTVLNFRVMMFRRNPLTIAFLCAVSGAIASVVALAILSIRAFYDDELILTASSELGQRTASALYTGALAIIIGPVLHWIGPWMGFRRPISMGGRR